MVGTLSGGWFGRLYRSGLAFAFFAALVVASPSSAAPSAVGELIERSSPAVDDPWTMVEPGESFVVIASAERLRAIEPERGTTAWTTDFSARGRILGLRSDGAGAVAVMIEMGDARHVVLVAESSGEEMADFALEEGALPVLAFGAELVVSASPGPPGTLVVARRPNGEVVWQRGFAGTVTDAAVAGGAVFIGGSTTGEPFAVNPGGDVQAWWALLSSVDGAVETGTQIAEMFSVVGILPLGDQALMGMVGADDQRWSLRSGDGTAAWETTVETVEFSCPCGAARLADDSIWLTGPEFEASHDGYVFDPSGVAEYHPSDAADVARTPNGGHVVVEPSAGTHSRWTAIAPPAITGVQLDPRHDSLRVSWDAVAADAEPHPCLLLR